MVHSLDQHRVARPTARILTGELQPFPTGGVARVCHEGAHILVREAWQVNATLAARGACGQCCGEQAVPVSVSIASFIVCDGQCTIQAVLCCPVVRTPAGTEMLLTSGILLYASANHTHAKVRHNSLQD